MKRKNSFFLKLFSPVNLTEGTPWKAILRYGAPIMLSYIFQQIYVISDAIICGQVLTAQQVAGVNDTFPLTLIFMQFAFGCASGFSVITAKCAGSNDKKGARASFAAQIYLNLIISAALTAASILLLPYMLRLINVMPTNYEVYNAAYVYCFIIFTGIIVQMGYNFVCGILRAYGDSVTPLIFLIISTLVNVALDVLFLSAFRMGPAGAAIATVVTQAFSFVGCFIYTVIKYKDLRLHKEDWKNGLKYVMANIKQGVPLGMQFSILAIGIIVMQSVVVKFDILPSGEMLAQTPAQNGFGAASKLINFLMSFYNGLGAALLGFNAQNFGKRNYDNIKKGTLQSVVMIAAIYVFCLVCGLLLSINGAYQHIFMSEDKITSASIAYGNTYIFVDFSLYFVLGFLIVIRSAVQGICRSGYVFAAGVCELVARILVCLFLPQAISGTGITANASQAAFAALCFADPAAWILASIVLFAPLVINIIKENYTVHKRIIAKMQI